MFTLIIFTDSANKYDFGGHRQTRDAIIFDTVIFDYLENTRVFTNTNATKTILEQCGCPSEIGIIDPNSGLPDTDEDCVIVLETGDFAPYMPFVSKIVHVDWGRNYLGERKFFIDENKYVLNGEEYMSGSSHDEVCIRTYVRR